jgi:hypothetical protein
MILIAIVLPLLVPALHARVDSGQTSPACGKPVQTKLDASVSKILKETESLRKRIVDAIRSKKSSPRAPAEVYKDLFERVGLEGLPALMKDKDTSIALQAAWEHYKKVAKKPTEHEGRTDWVLDRGKLKGFLAYYAARVKTKAPKWWQDAVMNIHASPESYLVVEIKSVMARDSRVNLRRRGKQVVVSAGGRAVTVREDSIPEDWWMPDGTAVDSIEASLGAERSFLTQATSLDRFPLICVSSRTGRRLWSAEIWGKMRDPAVPLIGTGIPPGDVVEVWAEGDRVIVYGFSVGGQYAEAFDANTGRPLFRFCTSYWPYRAQTWNLK